MNTERKKISSNFKAVFCLFFYFIAKFSSLPCQGMESRKEENGGSDITSRASEFMVFRCISQRWSHLILLAMLGNQGQLGLSLMAL